MKYLDLRSCHTGCIIVETNAILIMKYCACDAHSVFFEQSKKAHYVPSL